MQECSEGGRAAARTRTPDLRAAPRRFTLSEGQRTTKIARQKRGTSSAKAPAQSGNECLLLMAMVHSL